MAATTEQTQDRKVTRVGLEETPTIYCNNVETRVSPWDFRLTFGEVLEVTEDSLSVKTKAIVYMSPEHAKAFTQVMLSNIAEYERSIGRIPSQGEKVEIEDQTAESG